MKLFMQQYDRKFERERERALRRKARVTAQREREKRFRDVRNKFRNDGSFLVIGSVIAVAVIGVLLFFWIIL